MNEASPESEPNEEESLDLQLNVPHGVSPGSGTVPLGGTTEDINEDRETE